MPMLTGEVDFVVGIDTHKYKHTAAVADSLGGLRASIETASDEAGESELLAWARCHAPQRRVWAVEGSSSYGASLTRRLLALGETVYEVNRQLRRRRGKSDAIDALGAARTALASERLAHPRSSQERRRVRVLLVARELAANSHRTYLNHLRGELTQLPTGFREPLLALSTPRLLAACAELEEPSGSEPWVADATARIRRLVRRLRDFERDIQEDTDELASLMLRLTPRLLQVLGISTVLAAEFYNAWSQVGRIHSEAAFAAMAGVAPLPASSGLHTRHRLNRGGDRRLNRALYQAVLSRLRHDPETRAYASRRLAEGRTRAEIRRCLKRYLARRVFHALVADSAPS